jgi:hypothetical protein
MSIKTKVLAATAALTLVGGLGVGTLSASAETNSCGEHCVDIFSAQFGSHHHPNFLLDVFQQKKQVGTPIILFRTSTLDPAEDFHVSDLDTTTGAPLTVAKLYALDPGFFTNANVVVQYGPFFVYEFEYAPLGFASGLCVGVAATPFQGEKVTLQHCGFSARTFWIADRREHETFTHGYNPLINLATPTLTDPFVLTYPTNGYPTDKPRPVLTVTQLQFFTDEFPQVVSTQLWGKDKGVQVNR